jgi:hypothetical protein
MIILPHQSEKKQKSYIMRAAGRISVLVLLLELLISIPFWSVLFLPLALSLFPIRWGVQIALNFIYGKGRYTLAQGIDSVFANDSTKGTK